jgi:hypothetical protein
LSDDHSTDPDSRCYAVLAEVQELADATSTKPVGFTFPESGPFKTRPDNWINVRFDLEFDARFLRYAEQDQAALQQRADVERWIAAGNCTFRLTGEEGVPHYMFECATCTPECDGRIGMCGGCARSCHKGHDIKRLLYSPWFYCDCGVGGRVGKFKCQARFERSGFSIVSH